MTPEQFENLKIGDIVTHIDMPGRTWVLYRKDDNGFDVVLQSSMHQRMRLETHDNWLLFSTIIERRSWS